MLLKAFLYLHYLPYDDAVDVTVTVAECYYLNGKPEEYLRNYGAIQACFGAVLPASHSAPVLYQAQTVGLRVTTDVPNAKKNRGSFRYDINQPLVDRANDERSICFAESQWRQLQLTFYRTVLTGSPAMASPQIYTCFEWTY